MKAAGNETIKDLIQTLVDLFIFEIGIGLLIFFLFGYRILFIMSGSMEPVLHEKSIAIARVVIDKDSVGVGEIVTYKSPEMTHTVTHRIVERTEDGFILQGDNNEAPDSLVVKPEWIRYRVVVTDVRECR